MSIILEVMGYFGLAVTVGVTLLCGFAALAGINNERGQS